MILNFFNLIVTLQCTQKIDFLSYITDRRNNSLLNKHEEIRKIHDIRDNTKSIKKTTERPG